MADGSVHFISDSIDSHPGRPSIVGPGRSWPPSPAAKCSRRYNAACLFMVEIGIALACFGMASPAGNNYP